MYLFENTVGANLSARTSRGTSFTRSDLGHQKFAPSNTADEDHIIGITGGGCCQRVRPEDEATRNASLSRSRSTSSGSEGDMNFDCPFGGD